MFYRIIKAPPGYAAGQNYLVAAYETRDALSKNYKVRRDDGTLFAATLEDARRMLPENAKQLPFEPIAQFLELWEAESEPGSERR